MNRLDFYKKILEQYSSKKPKALQDGGYLPPEQRMSIDPNLLPENNYSEIEKLLKGQNNQESLMSQELDTIKLPEDKPKKETKQTIQKETISKAVDVANTPEAQQAMSNMSPVEQKNFLEELLAKQSQLESDYKKELEDLEKSRKSANLTSSLINLGSIAARNMGATTAPGMIDLAQNYDKERQSLMERYKQGLTTAKENAQIAVDLEKEKRLEAQNKAQLDLQKEQFGFQKSKFNKELALEYAKLEKAKQQGTYDKQIQQIYDKSEKLSDKYTKSGLPNFVEKISDIEQKLGMTLEEALAKGVDLPGYGRAESLIPDVAASQEARDLRQLIQGLKNVQISKQFGASQTTGEVGRFQKEVGDGAFEDDKAVLRGLINMKKAAQADAKNIEAGYSPMVLETYKQNRGFIPSEALQTEERTPQSSSSSNRDKVIQAAKAKYPNVSEEKLIEGLRKAGKIK